MEEYKPKIDENAINKEIEKEIEAMMNFANGLPQYMDDSINDFEKPTIKTEWLDKKMKRKC